MGRWIGNFSCSGSRERNKNSTPKIKKFGFNLNNMNTSKNLKDSSFNSISSKHSKIVNKVAARRHINLNSKESEFTSRVNWKLTTSATRSKNNRDSKEKQINRKYINLRMERKQKINSEKDNNYTLEMLNS